MNGAWVNIPSRITGSVQVAGSSGSHPVAFQRIARAALACPRDNARSIRTNPSVMNRSSMLYILSHERSIEIVIEGDVPRGAAIMKHGPIDRRSFLDRAGRLAVGGLTAGAVFEMMRPNAWAQQAAKETHPASERVLERLRTRFT